MKKLLVCLFILNGFACFAQEKALTWDYPVKPGMEEWTKFESRPEMAEACLIPDLVIKNISTSDLLELCLNYPLLHDIMFYNFPQMGFTSVSSSYNGFTELFRRDDAGTVLLKKYKTIYPEKVKEKSTGASRGFFIANLSLFEIVLSQDSIISKLSKNEKRELINEAHSKFLSKIRLAENYSLLGISTTPLVMGRVMKMDQFPELTELVSENISVAKYLETGSSYDFCMMQELADKVYEYSKLK